MDNNLTLPQTIDMFKNISKKIIENEPMLTKTDLQVGDGDHGIGMKTGFKAVLRMLDEKEQATIQELFKNVGMTLIDSMGGASGVLFGTLFISGISELERDDVLTLCGFQKALNKSIDAIMSRGGAKPGDKTMIDALKPAADELESSYNSGCNFKTAAENAYKAAKAGAVKTKNMQAKKGRARTYREKSVGVPDPGALSVMLIFEAVYENI